MERKKKLPRDEKGRSNFWSVPLSSIPWNWIYLIPVYRCNGAMDQTLEENFGEPIPISGSALNLKNWTYLAGSQFEQNQLFSLRNQAEPSYLGFREFYPPLVPTLHPSTSRFFLWNYIDMQHPKPSSNRAEMVCQYHSICIYMKKHMSCINYKHNDTMCLLWW